MKASREKVGSQNPVLQRNGNFYLYRDNLLKMMHTFRSKPMTKTAVIINCQDIEIDVRLFQIHKSSQRRCIKPTIKLSTDMDSGVNKNNMQTI